MSHPDIPRLLEGVRAGNPRAIGRAISLVEDGREGAGALLAALDLQRVEASTTLGITGPGGAGKSTLTQQLIGHYRAQGRRVGVVAVDPSSPISGGAILGDRIRMMRHAVDPDVVVRSMATRGRIGGLCASAGAAVRVLACSGCDPVIIETVGVGQAEIDIVRLADVTALVLAPGLGDDIQAMKAGLVELADILVVNKAGNPAAEALVMEMEPVARERGRGFVRTCATQGVGIGDLAAAVATGAEALRASGQLAQRRQRCREAEVLDWAVELMRPKLQHLLATRGAGRGDPRQAARRLLEQLSAEAPSSHLPPLPHPQQRQQPQRAPAAREWKEGT